MQTETGGVRVLGGFLVIAIGITGCQGNGAGRTTPAIQPCDAPPGYAKPDDAAPTETPTAEAEGDDDISKPRPGVTLAEVDVLTEHWPDGTPRIRRHMLLADEGGEIEHGRYTRWHRNGQKEYEAVFDRGKIVGTARRWHANGQLWSEVPYIKGERHGVSRMWDMEGNLRKEERFEKGKPHGTWTVYSTDGKIKAQSHFEHGKPVLP